MDLKQNQGVAFVNEKTKDTQPDFRGELNIDGKLLRLVMWKKTSKAGQAYLSLQVEEKKESEKDPFEF